TCTFCKASYQLPQAPSAPAPAITVVMGEAPPTPTVGRGCGGVGFVILVVVVLSIAVPIFLAVRNTDFGSITGTGPSSGSSGDYRFSSQSVTLPGEPSGVPSFVIADSMYESGKTVVRLLRFDGGKSEPAW